MEQGLENREPKKQVSLPGVQAVLASMLSLVIGLCFEVYIVSVIILESNAAAILLPRRYQR